MALPRSLASLLVSVTLTCLTGWVFIFGGIDSVAWARRPGGLFAPPGEAGFPRAWESSLAVSPNSVLNLRSGTLTTVIPLVSWSTFGPPVSFALFHSSHAARASTPGLPPNGAPTLRGFAPGWSSSYSSRIENVIGAGGPGGSKVVEDDGTENFFEYTGGQFVPPRGVHDRLVRDPQTDWYTLTRVDQSRRVFDASGRLVEEVDPAGNRLTIHRPCNEFWFIYDTTARLGLQGEPDPACSQNESGFALRLEFDEYGRLHRVVDRESRAWTLDYGPRQWWTPTVVIPEGSTSDPWLNWISFPPRSGIAPGLDLPAGARADEQIRLCYNADGTLLKFRERDELVWDYAYHPGFGAVSTVTHRGHTEEFWYCVPDPPGGQQQTICIDPAYFSVDPEWSLTTRRDRRGNFWHFWFDSPITAPFAEAEIATRFRAVTDPTLSFDIFDYDTANNVTRHMNSNYREWFFEHGPVGNVASATDPLGHTTSFSWESVGAAPATNFYRLIQVTDPEGKWTQFEHADANNPTRVTKIIEMPDGQGNPQAQTTLAYYGPGYPSLRGELLAVGDANGVPTGFTSLHNNDTGERTTYVSEGVAYPYSDPQRGSGNTAVEGGGLVNSIGLDDWNCMDCSETDDGTLLSKASNDAGGLSKGCLAKDDFLTLSEPERAGMPQPGPYASPRFTRSARIPSPEIASIDMCGASVLIDYLGRPTSVQTCLPDGAGTRLRNFAYNETSTSPDFKRLTQQTLTTDELGPSEATGSPPEWSFSREYHISAYDPYGLPLAVMSDDGRVTAFAYDQLGRLTTATRDPGQTSALIYEAAYDAARRLSFEGFANGAYVLYDYDDADRLTRIHHYKPNGKTLLRLDYTWSNRGLITQRKEYQPAVNPNDPDVLAATVNFTYDERGRLIHEARTGSHPYDLAYTYDQVGNRLTRIDALNHRLTQYFYDVDGVSWDPDFNTKHNRLMRYEEFDTSGATNVLARTVRYTYYKSGHASNITSEDAGQPGLAHDLALYYDGSGRLTIALWDRWFSDPISGNFVPGTHLRDRAVEFRYEGDSRQRYLMRELNPAQLPAIVPLASPKPLWTEYDPSGSPLLDLEANLAAAPKRLDAVRSYEALGSSETPIDPQTGIPGISMVRHADLIGTALATSTADPETPQGGDPGAGDPVDPVEPGDPINPHADPVDAGPGAGEPTVQNLMMEYRVYTAFGERVDPGPAGAGRYRYAGEWGYESGLLVLEGAPGTSPVSLLHLGARWYDPALGRFIQRDPIGIADGPNVYLYAQANPLDSIDPEGTWFVPLIQLLARLARFLIAPLRNLASKAWPVIKCGVKAAWHFAKDLRFLVLFHGPHHTFPVFGKKPHIEFIIFRKGVRNSGIKWRIPIIFL